MCEWRRNIKPIYTGIIFDFVINFYGVFSGQQFPRDPVFSNLESLYTFPVLSVLIMYQK